MLTAGQRAHFATFGFLVLRQHFTAEEMAIVKRESDEIFDEVRGGGRFAGESWEAVQPFFERRPFLSALPADDRIYNIGVDLLGPDFILEVTEGNNHVGPTPWHAATGKSTQIRHTKITFYPEAVTKDTGCLRVLPGSHRPESPDLLGMLRNRGDGPDFRPFDMDPSELPCYAIESQPGDVVVFTEELLHASFGGKPGRHQHAVNFIANPATESETAMVREMYQGSRFCYRPAESYVNSDNPRIRRMVSRLVEWGFETSKV
jgi:hypothetical protein